MTRLLHCASNRQHYLEDIFVLYVKAGQETRMNRSVLCDSCTFTN